MEISVYFNRLVRLVASLVAALVALVHWCRRRVHMVRLGATFPGPFALPLIGNAADPLSFDNAEMFRYVAKTIEKYGSIGRLYIGPNLIIGSKYACDNEVVLSRQKFLTKSNLYNKFLSPWLGDGLLISSGAKWHSRRKLLTPAFHFSILQQFAPVFHSCGDEFIKQLRKRAGGASFNVWPLVKLLALDVICETAMGVKVNAQTNSSSPYVNAIDEIAYISVTRGLQPWLYPDWVFYMTHLGRRYKKCLEILHGTTNRVIKEKKEELLKMEANFQDSSFGIDELGRRRRVAFLDLLLLAARDDSLSDADIREEVDTFMFEGHDTSASAISFTIFLLSRHPDVQEKVLEELKSVFAWPQPLKPSLNELSELKYLEMVIKESLRLYPPVMLFLRDIKQDQELPATGRVMPAGTVYIVSPSVLHRNPAVYPEPDKFLPERFAPEECAQRHPYDYLPFSAGPRNCIGQRFAMLELKSVLAKVVWNFRIRPEPGFEPTLVFEIILKSRNGVRVQLEERL